jgi:site-specific DNA recombinase
MLPPPQSGVYDALYARVSSEDQRERKTITTQKELGRFHCASRQLPEPVVYADDGVSGTIPFAEREAGARLLQDAREGRIRSVIVYRIDRLGRKLLDVLATIQLLQELGVSVVSISEPFDTSSPMGRAMLSIMCVFAELERETILERTQDGLNTALRAGTYCGAYAPFGYRKIGEGSASRLEADEEPIPGFDFSPADVIRWIFTWAADEPLSTRLIARRLTGMGVPTPAAINRKNWKDRRGIWDQSTIALILRNSDYKGVHRFGGQTRRSKRGRVDEQEIPAIVTADLWERAQASLDGNAARFPRAATYQYLLRGLIKCGDCGSTYGACMKGKGRRLYYGCGRRLNSRVDYATCPNPYVRGEGLEAAVWADCEGFLRNPGAVLEELAAQQSGQTERADAIHEDIARLARELDAKAKERNDVITMRVRGLIDEGEMEAQRFRILREEEDLKAGMERLRERLRGAEATQVSLEAVESLLRELNQRNDGPWSFEEKRRVVETLLKGITVKKGPEGEPVVKVRYHFAQPVREVKSITRATRPSSSATGT